MIAEGRFREDLYYLWRNRRQSPHLAGAGRRGLLARHFVNRFARE